MYQVCQAFFEKKGFVETGMVLTQTMKN